MRILKNYPAAVKAAVKTEAAWRLLLLDVESHARRSCASISGRLYRSETVNQNIHYINIDRRPERVTVGVNYFLEDNEIKAVNEFEKKYNKAVYFVLLSYTEFGPLYSFLYIDIQNPENKEDFVWRETADSKRYIDQFVFCCQIDHVGKIFDGEFGHIGIVPAAGGVIRLF